MKRIFSFVKKEAVLCISGLLALISCFFVPPSLDYIKYIDFRVLIILFCLMLVVAGIRQTGIFTVICEKLLSKLRSVKTAGLVMVLLCFFMSMLLTNDVTLITLVPFTILMFEGIEGEKKESALILLLVLETLAANLGSMLTPMGNPQNLYLYSRFNLTVGEFIGIIFPYSLLSLILLVISVIIFIPDIKIQKPAERTKIKGKIKPALFILLFGVNLLTILRLLDERILLIIITAAILILEKRLFAKADYSLLLTFVFFFVFVGNFGAMPIMSEGLRSVMHGNETVVSVLLSQIISNVPAALLLSGLSDNVSALIIGTNIGGLGTLIASMASLITYKLYSASKGSKPKKFFMIFTVFNLCFLAIMIFLYYSLIELHINSISSVVVICR